MSETKEVSAEDFGAVGDGVTDDTAAIQAAINIAVTNSSNVVLSFGTYLVTSLKIRKKLPNEFQSVAR